MSEKISNVRNISARIKGFVKENGANNLSYLTYASKDNIEKYCDGGRMSIKTIKTMADIMGVSVAETMLEPGLEKNVEWYRDANEKYFSENLRALAKDAGLSQVEISNLTGIHKNTINHYFKGKLYPRSNIMQLIADVIDVEVADFFVPFGGSER